MNGDVILGELRDIDATIAALQTSLKNWEAYEDDPNVDKLGSGFNRDDSFSAWKTEISLDSWKGNYGHSECGRFLHIGNEAVFTRHFVGWLNDHLREILQGVIDRMVSERANMARNVIAEAERAVDILKEWAETGDTE